MKTLQIANANFELELEKTQECALEESLEKHPVLLQLQFLPIICSDQSDNILVTQLPEKTDLLQLLKFGLWKNADEFPTFVKMNPFEPNDYHQITSWGYSNSVSKWAKDHKIPYFMPPFEVVREVNSKVFSFTHSPKLPQSELIDNETSLKKWLIDTKRPSVLKSSFGFSGRGHLIIKENTPWNAILHFCAKEWTNNRPLIAEPWMERVLDFSTQWKIETTGEIAYIGSTRIKNDSQGSYQSTLCGPEDLIFSDCLHFLEEHKKEAVSVLQLLVRQGYTGAVGIDAMVYKEEAKMILHPIVEINARQTMSLYALYFQRKWFPDNSLTISYTKKQGDRPGLLPTRLKKSNGEEIVFPRQLYFNVN